MEHSDVCDETCMGGPYPGDEEGEIQPKVYIKVSHIENLSGIDVLINGVSIGGGTIENVIYRDYSWIVPLLESLSRKLGAAPVTRDAPWED